MPAFWRLSWDDLKFETVPVYVGLKPFFTSIFTIYLIIIIKIIKTILK